MDKKEFAMFAMALKTYYPREQLLPNQQAMELWFRELQDIPMPVADAALRKWVQTNKWSPSIAEIREVSASLMQPEIPDWGEGWKQVQNAIRKYGAYRPKEAMDSLDPLTRQCVERMGFRDLCMSENAMADRANFRMIYENLSHREQVKQQLALPLQETIKMIQLKGIDGIPLLDDVKGTNYEKGNC